jgi:SH3-like domain-containing protein
VSGLPHGRAVSLRADRFNPRKGPSTLPGLARAVVGR